MAVNVTLNATQLAKAAVNADFSSMMGEIKPLLILILVIFIYSVFIFKFYRFLAEKDIIKQHWHKKFAWQESFLEKITKSTFFTLEYLIIVPIIVFFWFIVLAGIIMILSNNTPGQIMLVSMAIIGAIRIAAHYNNDLSKDLAKMIPFALLGVYIVDMKIISIGGIITKGIEFISMIDIMLFYLIVIAIIEISMRILQSIADALKTKKEREELKL